MRSWVERLFTQRSLQILGAAEEASHHRGKTFRQIALAWLLAERGVTSAIIGARNLAQLQENMGAGGWDFPTEQWKNLDDASTLPSEYPQDFQSWVEPQMHSDVDRN